MLNFQKNLAGDLSTVITKQGKQVKLTIEKIFSFIPETFTQEDRYNVFMSIGEKPSSNTDIISSLIESGECLYSANVVIENLKQAWVYKDKKKLAEFSTQQEAIDYANNTFGAGSKVLPVYETDEPKSTPMSQLSEVVEKIAARKSEIKKVMEAAIHADESQVPGDSSELKPEKSENHPIQSKLQPAQVEKPTVIPENLEKPVAVVTKIPQETLKTTPVSKFVPTFKIKINKPFSEPVEVERPKPANLGMVTQEGKVVLSNSQPSSSLTENKVSSEAKKEFTISDLFS